MEIPVEITAILHKQEPCTREEILTLKQFVQDNNQIVLQPSFAEWLKLNKEGVVALNRDMREGKVT